MAHAAVMPVKAMVVGCQKQSEAGIMQRVDKRLRSVEARISGVWCGADRRLQIDYGQVGGVKPWRNFGEAFRIVPCLTAAARIVELYLMLHGIACEHEFGIVRRKQHAEKGKQREESHGGGVSACCGCRL